MSNYTLIQKVIKGNVISDTQTVSCTEATA